MSRDFYSKSQLVVMRLARDLLATNFDERTKPIKDYVREMGVSIGTVQKAMQVLIDQKCAVIYFRGHLGSFIVEKDVKKLWEYTGFGTLTGAVGLPLNPTIAGLSTGICDCMRIKDIPFNCVFMQGSNTRVKGLQQGNYDFIVASSLTGQVVSEHDNGIEKVVDLPGCVYSGRYTLLFADPAKTQVEDGMRVAVDPTSFDQHYLTQLVCKEKKDIVFLEMGYLETHNSVLSGQSDVIISRMDYDPSSKEIEIRTQELVLPNHYTRKEIDQFGNAVVLARKDNYRLADLLRQYLRPNTVAYSQKQVQSGDRVARYY